ncbi:hypothetical protein FIBSPDRAFT_918440 [Athelia psychrophila]|uniref:Acyl-CoA desaturase n=1 Tax=Athelia psychrophila TaxID=1759441 RepID=A0A166NR69_9AGAM|nr:hypothetical protein FIBSPDRAFT_918440 [Fibularhizoctonia sp. CBS 109695]
MGTTQPRTDKAAPPKIWWSNSIFFVAIHVAAGLGAYFRPPTAVPWATLGLFFAVWQLADFGITIGYHRLYSHRAFRAGLPVRVLLAALGSAAFQGSIKWCVESRCLRHRLHHRFTDDPIHDPYAATRGLFYSHMGWIFYKPTYERMELVDREDLDRDAVVRFQHKHYVPLALFFGFVLPTLLGYTWGDPLGAFIWGGLVSRLAIWHCTFLVNSLAHWEGLQPFSDEDTSRGNLILALLTGGEGNHNFHAFPHDYRSGPSWIDWDPSKWIIAMFHTFGLASGLRRVRETDMLEAKQHMAHAHHHHALPALSDIAAVWVGDVWGVDALREYIRGKPGRCVLLLDGLLVDATSYLGEHPGGAALLRRYAVSPKGEGMDATWAFDGGLNNHSRAARRRMSELIVAKYSA